MSHTTLTLVSSLLDDWIFLFGPPITSASGAGLSPAPNACFQHYRLTAAIRTTLAGRCTGGDDHMKPKNTGRCRVRRYQLIEYFASGYVQSEDFPAPSDDEAVRRALDVCTAAEVEVWRSHVLIDRLPRDGIPPARRRAPPTGPQLVNWRPARRASGPDFEDSRHAPPSIAP